MEETKRIFATNVYEYSLMLVEAMGEVDEEGVPLWEISVKNAYLPQFLPNGQVNAVLVRKKKPTITELIVKLPTKSELIAQELIEELGEEQVGAAAIPDTPKQSRRSRK